MSRPNIALLLRAFLVGVAACGGSGAGIQPAAPPRVPRVTTTTSAPASQSTHGMSATQSHEATEAAPLAPDTTPPVRTAGPIDLAENAAGGAMPMVPLTAPRSMSENRASDMAFTDGEIVAVADAADDAEKELARQALRRARSGRVRQLAQQVLTDHVPANLEKVVRGAALKPLESATSTALRSSGAREASVINGASEGEFDRVYVETLEGQEKQLIRLLDDGLIPQAQNGELRTFLQGVRAAVASRRATAEDLYPSRER